VTLAWFASSIRSCGLRRAGREHAVATLERAVLRGPRPRAAASGLARALTNFSPAARKFRPPRSRRSAPFRSEDRAGLTVNWPQPCSLSANSPQRLSRSKASAASRIRSPNLPHNHRDVVAALSQQDAIAAAFAGTCRGGGSPTRSTSWQRAKPQGSPRREIGLRQLFARGARWPGRAPAAATGTARAYPRSA